MNSADLVSVSGESTGKDAHSRLGFEGNRSASAGSSLPRYVRRRGGRGNCALYPCIRCCNIH